MARPATQPEPLLLRIEEVAAALSVCPSTVYNLIRAGQLPAVRIGKREKRVPAAAVRQWVEDRAQTSA
jgi:excisionase family DNA binding protein